MYKQTLLGYTDGGLRCCFTYLDVGTSNAMILYSLAKEDSDMNLVTYERHLSGILEATPFFPRYHTAKRIDTCWYIGEDEDVHHDGWGEAQKATYYLST